MSGITIRRSVTIVTLALVLAGVASPALAQSGQIKGTVTDSQGKIVEGAKVQIQNLDSGTRPLEVKTNKKGEYIQVGLAPGRYKITVSKDALSTTRETAIHLEMLTFDVKLEATAATSSVSKEEAAKAKARADAMNKAFNEGVELSNQGKADEAIAKFNEVIVTSPKCAECYANIGTVQGQAKHYPEAEAAYKKAIELRPEFGEAYNGLANIYNAEKKFDLAAEASKKAMELVTTAPAGGAAGAPAGASASQVFNQAVILWNAGKIAEAKVQFEAAVKADPTMPDAQYWLGMAMVNGGDTAGAKPHFETYLKLAPTGQYADTAKAIVASLK